MSCCIAKRLKKNGRAHLPSIPTPQSLLQMFGQEKNGGTSFNDLKFSSFNPLFSFSPLQSTHYSARAFSLQHWSAAEAPGEFTEQKKGGFRQGGPASSCRVPSLIATILFFLPPRILPLWDSPVPSFRHFLVLATGARVSGGEWSDLVGRDFWGKCLEV